VIFVVFAFDLALVLDLVAQSMLPLLASSPRGGSRLLD
jgi:hypothetical protein